MKVLHVIPSLSKTYGGPSHALVDMTRHQSMSPSKTPEILTARLPNEEIMTANCPCYSLDASFGSFRFSFAMICWLLKNTSKYDLLHIHGIFNFPSTVAMIISRIKKKPYIVRLCGMGDKWSMKHRKYKKLFYYYFFEKFGIDGATFIHLTTEQEHEGLDPIFRDKKSYVLPLGVPTPKAPNGHIKKHDKTINILYMGRIHYKKGLDLLLETLKDISSNWKLIIAGTGEKKYLDKIIVKINNFGLKNKVTLLDHIDGHKKTTVLSKADIFVLPSFQENFGVAVAEAMSHGVAVAISKEVAIANIVKKENAGLVFTLNKSALKKSLERLLRDSSLRQRLGDNARNAANKYFDWDNITKKQLEIYRSILK